MEENEVMKKLLALLLVLALVASSLAGCGGAEDTGDTPSGDAELTVGFIYIGPKTDGGFSEAQDRGRQASWRQLYARQRWFYQRPWVISSVGRAADS